MPIPSKRGKKGSKKGVQKGSFWPLFWTPFLRFWKFKRSRMTYLDRTCQKVSKKGSKTMILDPPQKVNFRGKVATWGVVFKNGKKWGHFETRFFKKGQNRQNQGNRQNRKEMTLKCQKPHFCQNRENRQKRPKKGSICQNPIFFTFQKVRGPGIHGNVTFWTPFWQVREIPGLFSAEK